MLVSQAIRNAENATGNRGKAKLMRNGKPVDRTVISSFDYMRGDGGTSVLQAKVGDMFGVVYAESEVPPKPEYVPLEDSLFVGPAINTKTVNIQSLKHMDFALLYRLENKDKQFIDWQWFRGVIKKIERRSDGHLWVFVKFPGEKGYYDIDLDESARKYEVISPI